MAIAAATVPAREQISRRLRVNALKTLNDLWARPGRVQFSLSPLGGPVVELAGPAGTAVVALQGAQLLSWQPAGHAPVIWLSPVERLGTEKPVRGGTPVCWPWFGAHPSDRSQPAHGFVRTRIWTVTRAGVTTEGAWLELTYQTGAADAVHWPHQATATLRITLDRQLSLTLRTDNTGSTAFTLTQALHTYFSIGDIGDLAITGFETELYLDTLTTAPRQLQTGPITFAGEVDRIYDAHSQPASIIDTRLRRRITITTDGSRSAVVWNPWIAKAARLGDLGPGDTGQGGWRQFVCVETTNAGLDAVTVVPGHAHTIAATYTVNHAAGGGS
jgi:D-hexose-6-phosphate mutarotase